MKYYYRVRTQQNLLACVKQHLIACRAFWQLIRSNEVPLSLFCFIYVSYSAATWNRGRTEHEHSNNRAGL